MKPLEGASEVSARLICLICAFLRTRTRTRDQMSPLFVGGHPMKASSLSKTCPPVSSRTSKTSVWPQRLKVYKHRAVFWNNCRFTLCEMKFERVVTFALISKLSAETWSNFFFFCLLLQDGEASGTNITWQRSAVTSLTASWSHVTVTPAVKATWQHLS